MANKLMASFMTTLDDVAENEGHDQSGEEWLLTQIAEGVQMQVIARRLGVPRHRLYAYLQQTTDREACWRAALAMAAHSLVEEAVEIADGSAKLVMPAEVNAAKLRVSVRQWLAAKRNRAAYGEPEKTGGATLNIENLFLAAAQERAAQRALPPTEPMEAEVVEEEGDPWD